MKKNTILMGKVTRKRATFPDAVAKTQFDSIQVDVPFDLLSEDGLRCLAYWGVYDFDTAYVDWNRDCIHLEYTTMHPLTVQDEAEEDIEEVFD